MERYMHSFGASFSVAVLFTALVYAIKAVFPDFGEWTEEVFGHAWFYMGVLALIIYVGLGLSSVRWTSTSQGLATLVAGSAIVSGSIIGFIAIALALLGRAGG